MRKINAWISILLSMILVSLILIGCSNTDTDPAPADTAASDASTTRSEEPITITFFDKNKGDIFNDPVAQEITRNTGIYLDIQQPTTDADEKLNLMFASQDYSDMIMFDRNSPLLKMFIDGGAILPLNDLIEEHTTEIPIYYEDVLPKIRHEDSQNYYLTSWYDMDTDPSSGVLLRMDYSKEILGDKMGTPEPITLDEYFELLTTFKEKKEIAGSAVIPLAINGDSIGGPLSIVAGMYGIKTYHEVDNRLMYPQKHPNYIEVYKFFNRAYREGLLDKEWASTKSEMLEQKMASDTTLSTLGNWWFNVNPNATLMSVHDNIEAQFYSYKVVPKGMSEDDLTLCGRSTLGWDAITITDKNPYPVESIQFMDYLTSEEGQYNVMWGVEGEHWNMVEDVHTPTEETLQAIEEDLNLFNKETGVHKWAYATRNGNGSDGTPFDLSYKYDRGVVDTFSIESLRNTNWDSTPYSGLSFEPNSEEAMIDQAVQEELTRYHPKIIMANTEEECVALFEELLATIDTLGAETVEAYRTELYQAQLTDWGMA